MHRRLPRSHRATAVLIAALAAGAAACDRVEEAGPGAGPAGAVGEDDGTAPAALVPPARFPALTGRALAAVEAAGEDWPTHGGAYSNQRYSTLSQIDRENVSRLAPAWVHQTGVPAAFETTPLVVGNTMYLTTPESRVLALNAATGRKLWEFVPEMEEAVICCGPANRGVAAYGERVFVGTLDARLFALDHRSGEIEWETTVAEAEDGYSITMAPLAYDGKVLVGVSGGEYGIRGFVAA
ncbi:MAG: PQQ-binding-like beta-propeller repeat protein, partial [Gemmatimonadota bacterium]